MSFKLALKHSFIQNLSSLLHFISKLASLLINPEDWQEGGGGGEKSKSQLHVLFRK